MKTRGVAQALGDKRGGYHWGEGNFENGGDRKPVFLTSKATKPFNNNKLTVVTYSPILYRPEQKGARDV